MLDDLFDAAFAFDYIGGLQALGVGAGYHIILAADSFLHWSQASKLLDGAGIGYKAHLLAGNDCLFTVSEQDGEKAERLLERYGGRVYHAPLDDLMFWR